MKIITPEQEVSAVSLYLQGNSGLKIAKKFNISVTQVYDTLKRNDIPRRNSIERLKKAPLSFQFRENLSPKEEKLLVAGIMLYSGEGAKTGKTVDFVNSDPKILKVFITFLRKICQVDESKLRLYLYCFSDQNLEKLKCFWGEELNLDIKHFTKPYVKQNIANLKRKLEWGVLHIRYNDKRLLEKILFLCSNLAAELI